MSCLEDIVFAKSDTNKLIFKYCMSDGKIIYTRSMTGEYCPHCMGPNHDIILSDDLNPFFDYKLKFKCKINCDMYGEISPLLKFCIGDIVISSVKLSNEIEKEYCILLDKLNYLTSDVKHLTIKSVGLAYCTKISNIILSINSEKKYEYTNDIEHVTIHLYHFLASKGGLGERKNKYRMIFKDNIDNFNNIIIDIKSIEDEYNTGNIKIKDTDLFMCNDIVSLYNKPRVDIIKYISNMMPKNRYYHGFESPCHASHVWKIEEKFFEEYFDMVFVNSHPLMNGHNIQWIPLYHQLFFKYDDSNKISFATNKKDKFMVNNPISSGSIHRETLVKNIGDRCDFYFYGTNKPLMEHFSKKMVDTSDESSRATGVLSVYKKEKLARFKFVLVCENANIKGYITEKLIDALFSKNVVIYYSHKETPKFLPDLFENGVINGYSYTIDSLITYLTNMTDDEYNTRVDNISKFAHRASDICAEYSTLCYIFSHHFGNRIKLNYGAEYINKINETL